MNIKSRLKKIECLLLTLLILPLVIGCNEHKTTSSKHHSPHPSVSPSEQVHVAFSGGGWRAHTGHSGWIMSLLQDGAINLETAFKNVHTISSNSGGSWFSTMLALSDNFVAEIEAKDAISQWKETGWLGKQHAIFRDTPGCDHFYDISYEYLLCVLNANSTKSVDWAATVKDVIYKGYPMDSATLSGKRQKWAEDKALLIAGSMLTGNVVLNEYGEDYSHDHSKYQYYQACHSPATPKMGNLRLGASCTNATGKFREVTPVIFSGLPKDSPHKAPPFLPGLKDDESFSVGYSEVILVNPVVATTTISNPIDNSHVLAINAAASSSAALGFLSAVREYDLKWWWAEADGVKELAPSFSLSGPAKLTSTAKLTAQELADKKIVRIADGGPVDNSGVTQILTYLQANNESDNFNIVAFNNTDKIFPAAGSNADVKARVGVSIANLFGIGVCSEDKNMFCVGGCGLLGEMMGCVYVPQLQVFEEDALFDTAPIWHKKDGNMELIYTKYTVTTIDNHDFGITGNVTGVLHAFTCITPDVNIVPTAKDFTDYEKMVPFIYNSLNEASEGDGLRHLKKAFGL